MITLDFLCVLFGGATALMPIFARDILAIGPAGLGFLRSAPALGALATGLMLTRRPPRRRVGRQLLVTIAVYGAATLVFGLSRSFALSLAALMIVGAADMLSVIIRQTMIQIAAPNAIRGRVTAVTSLFTGASNQVGQFESGVTAAWFGPVGLGGAGRDRDARHRRAVGAAVSGLGSARRDDDGGERRAAAALKPRGGQGAHALPGSLP